MAAAAQVKLAEAHALLETELSSPSYDYNLKEAERKFRELLKDNKDNSLAWMGLFGVLLHQCKKTFQKQEKIPGTEYWLRRGSDVFIDFFEVDGYFWRVVVGENGQYRSYLLDSILQPGRKAKLYLENAKATGQAEEKAAAEALLSAFFEKATETMALKGREFLMRKRAEARNSIDEKLKQKK